MRYIIAGATAFALVAGIALGFVLSGRAFEAEAKPPPPEPAGGRVIPVVSNVNLAASEVFVSGFFDTADCKTLAVMMEGPFGNLRDSLLVSPDGVTTTGQFTQTIGGFKTGFSGNRTNYYYMSGGSPLVSPKTALQLEETSGSIPAGVIEVWLYCAP